MMMMMMTDFHRYRNCSTSYLCFASEFKGNSDWTWICRFTATFLNDSDIETSDSWFYWIQ